MDCGMKGLHSDGIFSFFEPRTYFNALQRSASKSQFLHSSLKSNFENRNWKDSVGTWPGLGQAVKSIVRNDKTNLFNWSTWERLLVWDCVSTCMCRISMYNGHTHEHISNAISYLLFGVRMRTPTWIGVGVISKSRRILGTSWTILDANL